MTVCAFPGCGHPHDEHTDHFCWHDDCNTAHGYAGAYMPYPEEPRTVPDGSRAS